MVQLGFKNTLFGFGVLAPDQHLESILAWMNASDRQHCNQIGR
jgi:hypothetical protein